MGGPAFNITTETVTAANVGIGTSSPGQKLDVRGNAYVQDVIYLGRKDVEKHFIIRNINSTTDSTAWAISLRTDIGGDNNNLKFTRFDDTGGYIDIPMVIEQSSGNIGIGTTTPSEKLEVNGKVKAAKFVSQAADGSLLRDVANELLSLGGGYTRRGINTSGGLIQLLGNARPQNPGSIQYILGEGASSPRHIFYDNGSDTGPGPIILEIASIDKDGKLTLKGPLGQIHGQPNVGIASNSFDDLIFNYGGQTGQGIVLWMWGAPQGGGDQGGGTPKMKLEVDGSLWLGSTPRKAIDSQGRCLYG